MAKQNYNTWSITISPKNDLEKEVRSSDLRAWLDDHCSHYVMGFEKGKNGHEHYQIGIETHKPMRQDKLRMKILEYCRFDTDTVVSVALKVHRHQDLFYLLGYCMKEEKVFNYKFPDAVTEQECRDKYATGKSDYVRNEDTRTNENKNSWSVDTVAEQLIVWCKSFKKTLLYPEDYKLFVKENRSKIKFTVYQKIKFETLQEYLACAL